MKLCQDLWWFLRCKASATSTHRRRMSEHLRTSETTFGLSIGEDKDWTCSYALVFIHSTTIVKARWYFRKKRGKIAHRSRFPAVAMKRTFFLAIGSAIGSCAPSSLPFLSVEGRQVLIGRIVYHQADSYIKRLEDTASLGYDLLILSPFALSLSPHDSQ